MSDSDNKDQFDFSKLDSLLKALKENKMTVRVGILGSKNARTDGGSNATIGACHEFGTSKIPQRSFLRMPLSENLPKELNKLGLFNQKDIDQIIKTTNMKDFANKIGTLAVETVLRAFDSGGGGQWKSLSPITLKIRARKNQGAQILVRANSHQLRDSITYDVKAAK